MVQNKMSKILFKMSQRHISIHAEYIHIELHQTDKKEGEGGKREREFIGVEEEHL